MLYARIARFDMMATVALFENLILKLNVAYSEMSNALPHVIGGGVRGPGGAQRPALPPTQL